MNRAQRRQAAKKQAIEAAISVADQVADGSLDPEKIEEATVEECRELFGKVVGPEDALWDLQVDVAKRVLAAGGVEYRELAEWCAIHPDRPKDHNVGATPGGGAISVEQINRVEVELLAIAAARREAEGVAVTATPDTEGSDRESDPAPGLASPGGSPSLSASERTARSLGCGSPTVCAISGCSDPQRCASRGSTL